MSQNIRVSVLIQCYNHEKFIADAIESVLAQTYKNYEIIVTSPFLITDKYILNSLNKYIPKLLNKTKKECKPKAAIRR